MGDLLIINSGQELMSRLIEGTTTATFIKLVCSAHDYSQASTEDLLQLTGLDDIRQTALVSKITRTDDALVDVLAVLDNSKLTEGYYIRALGLYAKDGDGTEILYGVYIAEDGAPDYMPAFGEKAVTSITYHVITKVGISANVTLEVNPAAYPPMEQVESIEKAVLSVKEKLDGIEDGANKTIVDTELSETSENPVQNKVIAARFAAQGAPVLIQEDAPSDTSALWVW